MLGAGRSQLNDSAIMPFAKFTADCAREKQSSADNSTPSTEERRGMPQNHTPRTQQLRLWVQQPDRRAGEVDHPSSSGRTWHPTKTTSADASTPHSDADIATQLHTSLRQNMCVSKGTSDRARSHLLPSAAAIFAILFFRKGLFSSLVLHPFGFLEMVTTGPNRDELDSEQKSSHATHTVSPLPPYFWRTDELC